MDLEDLHKEISKSWKAHGKSENYISRGSLGFHHDAGTTVHGSGEFHSYHGRQSEVRAGDFHLSMSGTAGSYGCDLQRNNFGLFAHEALPVVAQNQRVSLTKAHVMVRVMHRVLHALSCFDVDRHHIGSRLCKSPTCGLSLCSLFRLV